MKILVVGITGMLGSTVYRYFSGIAQYQTYGTLRNDRDKRYFKDQDNIISGVDVLNVKALKDVISDVNPNFVINCVGAIKQLAQGNDPLQAIPLNSLHPHILAKECQNIGARLIHISTDCVFSGNRGHYTETDTPDAIDIYGRSKMLGEVDYDPCLTLRTSIIGHELNSNRSLICWFLSQQGQVHGYTKTIYTGLPTIELTEVIEKIILEHPDLSGLFHVASDPISKYELLTIVRDVYQRDIDILESSECAHDKSLDASRFNKLMVYTPPDWNTLIKKMYDFEQRNSQHV